MYKGRKNINMARIPQKKALTLSDTGEKKYATKILNGGAPLTPSPSLDIAGNYGRRYYFVFGPDKIKITVTEALNMICCTT